MSMWIQCGAFFSEKVRQGPYWLRIEDGRFQEIQQSAPEGVSEDQIPFFPYLAPLLSDIHVHLYMNPWPLAPKDRAKPGSGSIEAEIAAAESRAHEALRKGVGLVRDMGDPFGINLIVREQARLNRIEYPIILAPGPALHKKGRYGRFLGKAHDSLEELLQSVDHYATEGVDFIKVVSTGIVRFQEKEMNQTDQLDAMELRSIVNRATAHGLKVASHCSGVSGIDANLEGGVTFIEHAYFITPAQIEKMSISGAYWTPTLAPVWQQMQQSACGWDEATRIAMGEILSDHLASIKSGWESGVSLLAGTDAGSPGVAIGEGLFLEMEFMARSLPWTTVLAMATCHNADAMGVPAYTGRIGPGNPASFVAYEEAPWLQPSVLRKPLHVFQEGRAVLMNPVD